MTLLDLLEGHQFVAVADRPNKGFHFSMWRPSRWIPIAIMWYDDNSRFWRRHEREDLLGELKKWVENRKTGYSVEIDSGINESNLSARFDELTSVEDAIQRIREDADYRKQEPTQSAPAEYEPPVSTITDVMR